MILISPSKTMGYNNLEKVQESVNIAPLCTQLRTLLNQLNMSELKSLYKCSDLVASNAVMLNNHEHAYKAIRLFEGAVFKNLDYNSLDTQGKNYVKQELFIFSAMYGLIGANQGIRPYRLDLNNKLEPSITNLSNKWKPYVNELINKQNTNYILDLASSEYRKLLDINKLKIPYVRVEFKENKMGTYKTIGTYAKMARGQFVKALAQDQIYTLEAIKKVNVMDYQFNESLSSESFFIYTR